MITNAPKKLRRVVLEVFGGCNYTCQMCPQGFEEGREYIVLKVPNIVDISYGRGVGYTFTEHDLGEEIHKISATKIRKEMRNKGDLKNN